MTNAWDVLVRNAEGNRPHAWPWCIWENSMKIDLKETGWELIWFRTGTIRKFLWIPPGTFSFYKMQVIFTQMLDSQVPRFIEVVNLFGYCVVCPEHLSILVHYFPVYYWVEQKVPHAKRAERAYICATESASVSCHWIL